MILFISRVDNAMLMVGGLLSSVGNTMHIIPTTWCSRANKGPPDVPPDYVPDVMRELTTSLDVYSGGVADAGGIHVAANAAGVRYPNALCGRR